MMNLKMNQSAATNTKGPREAMLHIQNLKRRKKID